MIGGAYVIMGYVHVAVGYDDVAVGARWWIHDIMKVDTGCAGPSVGTTGIQYYHQYHIYVHNYGCVRKQHSARRLASLGAPRSASCQHPRFKRSHVGVHGHNPGGGGCCQSPLFLGVARAGYFFHVFPISKQLTRPRADLEAGF